MENYCHFIDEFISVSGHKNIITKNWTKEPYTNGWRYGKGQAAAVVKPASLIEMWEILKICVKHDLIIIMQAANTGLTGGSTPYGNDYDRPVVIISTLKIKTIQIINEGKQIIALAGSTLYDLENKLKPINREPHSVIGSTSIGASIVGGVCNNSGGSLVHRGPAFTQLSLYAKINEKGNLELINDLDIDLGSRPEEILSNLENNNYNSSDIKSSEKLASDNKYETIVRDVDKNTPARFNADERLLYGSSGSAGKVAVFAVRLNTYPKPNKSNVFYIGTNNPDNFTQIRKDILVNFKTICHQKKSCYRLLINSI